jgi:hypothetical protein
MRKVYLAVVLSLVTALAVNAQGIGIKAGINLANMVFDSEWEESFDLRLGFHGGIVFEVGLTDAIFFGSGIIFSQKGTKFSYTDEDFDDESYSGFTLINYLEVPINLLYKADLGGAKLVFEAGPYLGYAINGKEQIDYEDNGTSISFSEDIEFGNEEDQVKRIDYGINVGVGLEFSSFKVGAQYGLGLANLTNYEDSTMKNQVIGVSVGYFLGR